MTQMIDWQLRIRDAKDLASINQLNQLMCAARSGHIPQLVRDTRHAVQAAAAADAAAAEHAKLQRQAKQAAEDAAAALEAAKAHARRTAAAAAAERKRLGQVYY